MRKYLGHPLLLFVSFLFFFAGCAHTPGKAKSAAPRLNKLMPLAVGNSWTYKTYFQGQEQPDLTVEISKEENGFFVDNRPKPSRFRVDAEGIRDGAVRYLLKAPIAKGTKWMSVADVRTVEHYEIVETGKTVKVPAGSFPGCVVVRMQVNIKADRTVENRMTFAPGVGIVEIAVNLKEGAKLLPQSRMVLKRYNIAP